MPCCTGQLLGTVKTTSRLPSERRFMGQAPTPSNRLLPCYTENIISRCTDKRYPWCVPIAEVAKGPTAEEAADLGLIDAFFKNIGAIPVQADSSTCLRQLDAVVVRESLSVSMRVPVDRVRFQDIERETAARAAHILYAPTQFEYQHPPPNVVALARERLKILCADKFLYPPRPTLPPLVIGLYPRDGTNDHYRINRGDMNLYAINQKLPWGEIKQAVLNSLVADEALVGYPWPKFLGKNTVIYWIRADNAGCTVCPSERRTAPLGFYNLIHSKVPITKEIVRVYVTMSILSNMEKMAEVAQHDITVAAKHAAANARLMQISFAVFGAVLAFAGAPMLVGALFRGGTGALSALNASQTAQGLADSVKGFGQSDPAFAAEIQRTSDVVNAALKASVKAADAGAPVVNGNIPVPVPSLPVEPQPSGVSPVSLPATLPVAAFGGNARPSEDVKNALFPEETPPWVIPAVAVGGLAATGVGLYLLGAFDGK